MVLYVCIKFRVKKYVGGSDSLSNGNYFSNWVTPVSFPSFVTISTTLINFSCAQFVSPVFCYPVGILAICIHPLVSHSQLPDSLVLTDMKLSRHFPEFPMASCFYFSVMFKVVHQVLSCILPGRLADLQMFDSASLVLHLGGGDILP